jgi:FAD synthetase
VAYKSKRKKIVLASGVFDLLHLGHVRFLEEAKKAGGKNAQLLVIVARDSTVQETKGRKPVIPENQRLALVESLKVVNEALLGLEDFDVGEVIRTIKPDVIALGYDQKNMVKKVQDYVNENKLQLKIVQIGKFGQDELGSSSKIRQKIVENFSR